MANTTFKQIRKPKTVADIVRPMMRGVCRKRGFANADILHNWSSIVGTPYAGKVQPEKIIWPRGKDKEGQTLPEPGTLVVRTDSATAVLLMHESPQLIERLNTYFGWGALHGIKITDGPVVANEKNSPIKLRPLTQLEAGKLRKKVENVKQEKLRNSLLRLGENLIASRNPNVENVQENQDEF